MIRREACGGATETRWVLISQVDHARLSGELAERWGAGGVQPLVARDQLHWAISHHDDGWRSWEQAPDVDPKTGRPRSFTEMDLSDSLEIWGRSIAAAIAGGPLAAYVVAGHFCALLRRFGGDWRNGHHAAEAHRFLADQDRAMAACLAAWQAAQPADNTPARAQLALAQLQFFDMLSLWFCCSEATEPDQVETPSGPTITLAPLGPAASGEPTRVAVSPWPFHREPLNLEIAGRSIPARRYENRADLAAAPSQTLRLSWQLQQAL